MFQASSSKSGSVFEKSKLCHVQIFHGCGKDMESKLAQYNLGNETDLKIV
jgi:hypothetical protein